MCYGLASWGGIAGAEFYTATKKMPRAGHPEELADCSLQGLPRFHNQLRGISSIYSYIVSREKHIVERVAPTGFGSPGALAKLRM